MLTYLGSQILCLHERLELGLPKLHVQRTQFAGIWGESEIYLGTGGRDISCKVWLTDASFGSAQSVKDYVAQMTQFVGANGELQESGAAPGVYADCTFQGVTPTGPIMPAIGAGLAAGSFWCPATLHWYQLSVP